jgi:hypothetical protein
VSVPTSIKLSALVAVTMVGIALFARSLTDELRLRTSMSNSTDRTDHQNAAVSTRSSLNSTSAPSRNKVYRAQFRSAHDYSLFVPTMSSAAMGGDPGAEYLTAKALRYCAENLRAFFRGPDGSNRTLDEVQVRMAKIPHWYELSSEIYDHCGAYLDDPVLMASTANWEKWLDKAVAANYPPAQIEKADVLRVSDMMREAKARIVADNLTSGDIIPPTAGPARDLALTAVLSGDPDAILGMANWVDGTKHSQDEYQDLVSAWELLACQRGYDDCGPNSELLRSVCMYDPQCPNDANVIDLLQRQLGTRFDDARRLAESIGVALDTKNKTAIEPYL